MFENSVKIKPIVYRFPRMIWSDNQIELKRFLYWFRNIHLPANIPLLLTSCSLKNNCQLANVKYGTNWYQSSKRSCHTVFHKIPGHVLYKNTRNLYTFFPSSFNRKYAHTVACMVVFLGPAHFEFNFYLVVLFPAVPTKTMVTRSL